MELSLDRRVEIGYPLPQIQKFPSNFRLLLCKQRAEWTFFTKAAELRIQTGFHDGQGQWHTTGEAALKLILDAMPVRTPHRFVASPVVVGPARVPAPSSMRLPRFP